MINIATKRITIWLEESQIKDINLMTEIEDFKNPSKFIGRAVEFYLGYLATKKSTQYISDILIGEMNGIVKSSETRIQRQLYHNTTELNMLINVFAYHLNLPSETIDNLRNICRKEVFDNNGAITVEQAYEYQNGGH